MSTSATPSQVPAPDGAGETRIERDSMGELPVPSGAYYGASTQRAVHNFPISPHRFQRRLIRALGLIKRAGADIIITYHAKDAANWLK